MSLVVQLEFKAHAGKEADFLRVAQALVNAAAAEPTTLRYQWFATQKPGH